MLEAAFTAETERGRAAVARRDWPSAVHHFERAHILGQQQTALPTLVAFALALGLMIRSAVT